MTFHDPPPPHTHTHTLTLFKERQTEYNLLSTDKATYLLTKAQLNVYDSGDKASKLLAQLAKIHNEIGELITNHMEINNAFKQNLVVYLYSSECDGNLAQLQSFFDKLTLPSVSADQNNLLGGEISDAEILQAINSLKCNKTPGPDGYTSEFYKKFALQLCPLLRAMLNESWSSGYLPPSLRQAAITLLPKGGKDLLQCSSYRPISLLNTDYKVLSKILTTRLEKVITQIILPDQTGFIINRHSSSNLRRLLNIVYSSSSHLPEMAISLDAEKAFDRVEWQYLFFTLTTFGFDDSFISWIKLLYSLPVASVITNGQQSELFSLNRGTRQGCSLSPLLFAIAIEPLAAALRQSNDFLGLEHGGISHKLSLYVDDIILYVADPLNSIPAFLSILTQFGKLSGYKINYEKSEILPLNQPATLIPASHLPFRIVRKGFRYLGIEITPTFPSLFKKNFATLFEKSKKDMARWAKLPLSIVGRILIPILIKKAFFNSLHNSLPSFIWNGKPHRINRNALQRPKELAGLVLPNCIYYYWACNIKTMLHWRERDQPGRHDAWVQMETSSSPLNLGSVLCAPVPPPFNQFQSNLVVYHSIRIWSQFRRHFKLHTTFIHSPIKNNYNFPPSFSDSTFGIWSSKGIKSMSNLYVDGKFGSFTQLSQSFDLPKSHFFRYLQLRHYVQKSTPSFPDFPTDNVIDHILSLSLVRKGLTSTLYDSIFNITPHSPHDVMRLWENDLGAEMADDQWEAVLKLIHSSSPCARHSLIQLKIALRAHLTKAKLAKNFPSMDPACPRCKGQPADYIHMFWSCPRLNTFWANIFNAYSIMF